MGMRDTEFRYSTTYEDEDEAYEIVFIFNGHIWNEAHPYGSTVAYEPMSEVDELHEIIVGDTPYTEVMFAELLGKEVADRLITQAWDNAEVYE